MANGSFTFDVSAGREVELYNRVLDSDPTNAVFTLMVLAAGHPADETLRSAATFADILLEADEVTNTGYARVTLSDADLSALVVDATNHTTTIPFPTTSWTGVSAGDTWSKLIVGYDSDSTGGTDSLIVPVFAQVVRNQSTGIALVPSGGDVVFSWPYGIAIVR